MVRWLPASGLAAALALALTGLIVPAPPAAGGAAQDIVTYYQAHRTGLEIESAVDAVGVMLLALFAATLHSQLKSAPSLMAFGAACILASCTLIEVAAFQSMAYRPTSDPALAALFSDFQGFAF